MVLHIITNTIDVFGCPVLPADKIISIPEVSVNECWWFPPALIGLWLKETVVNVDRMRQIQPALLIT